MSDIYQINDEYRRKLLRMERSVASGLVREYGQAWRAIRKRAINAVAQYERAAAGGETSAAVWLYEANRLTDLQKQVEVEIARFAKYADEAITKEQKEAVRLGQKGAMDLMRSSMPSGVKVVFNQLPNSAFENLIGFLQDGSPLKVLLDELPGEAGKAAANALKTGLLLGWNPTKTARSMRDALGGNLARALRIARTETLRSYRETSRQIFKENQHVLKGWRWVSARNERTCAMCWAMDGTEHSFDEQLEEHNCGRCSMVPITRSWRELGFDIDEIEAIRPATGIEAFGLLSDTEQLKILGPAKYAAWKEGKFKLSDLVGRKYDPQWGWTRYEKSLVELLGKEEAKGYTRLALMGVAKNAGNYSVDDLVRIAGVGLRELTDAEVTKIVHQVAKAGFESGGSQTVTKMLEGQVWNGRVHKAGDFVEPGVFHYLKHVKVQEEWPVGTSYDQYLDNLRDLTLDKNTGIIISNFDNNWQVGFVGESGKWRGPKGFSYVLLEYRVKYKHWVTGFQLDDFEALINKNHGSLVWIRKLIRK